MESGGDSVKLMNSLSTDNRRKINCICYIEITSEKAFLKEIELIGKVELHLRCDRRFKKFSKKYVLKLRRWRFSVGVGLKSSCHLPKTFVSFASMKAL